MNETEIKQVVLCGFELNRAQTILFLSLSAIGIFMLPLILAIEIFSKLFQAIFFDVPNYLLIIDNFPVYREGLWFFYIFAPIITRILIFSIFLFLSIHSLQSILKPSKFKREIKRVLPKKERFVKWFRFKLTHGQSLFIHTVSLAGIFFVVQFFFESNYDPVFMINTKSFCKIGDVSNRSLSFIISLILSIIFISLCLYSLIAVRRKRTVSPSTRTIRNHGLILHITFLTIFLFFLMRIFCHIILFTELASVLGVPPATTTLYQVNDLIRSFTIMIISVIMIILSYFMREKKHNKLKVVSDLTWIRKIKLTPNRALFLLALAILFIIYFVYYSITIIFMFGPFFYLSFPSFVFFPVILLCYYSINKVLKNNRFNNILSNVDSSVQLKTKWFKFSLKRADSIVFLSVSSGAIVIYIFYLIGINSFLGMIANIDYLVILLHELIGFLLVMIVVIAMLAIVVYTIKKTLPSIKSRE
jgi:hypothetical protein